MEALTEAGRANPLRRTLSGDEQRLLAIVADVYLGSGGAWPVWDFVERRMLRDFGVDARPVLTGLPKVKELYPIASYGLVVPTVWSAPHPIASDPNDRVGLTVAGLARTAGAQGAKSRIEAVLEVVRWLAEREGSAIPNPAEPVVVRASWSEIRQLLAARPARHSETWIDSVITLLEAEAPLWGATGRDPFDLNPSLRIFRGLGTNAADVGDYLDRVADWIQPSRNVQPLLVPLEPTAILEALDHLDAIVRLSEDVPAPGRALAALGELSRLVASRQDFEDRASTLVDCLAHLHVPGYDPKRHSVGPTLAALEKYMSRKVDAVSLVAIESAIDVLRAVADVRHAKEHGEAAFRAPKAYLRLGVPWPDTDWSQAWTAVGQNAVTALRVLREEVQRAAG